MSSAPSGPPNWASDRAIPKGPKQPKLRVSYLLRTPNHEPKHCFGVNSLLYDPASALLYSAGRDSSIFSWSVDKGAPLHVRSFQHHTDWVNDIRITEDSKILMSCSSDTTIKLWRTNDASCIRTLNKHQDYVKGMAYSPQTKQFVTAGLDRMIYLWDLEASVAVAGTEAARRSPLANRLEGHKDSIYSVTMNRFGSVIASGSSERVVRIWDPRSGQKQQKLKGHTDTVKCVLLSDDGTLCLSGSSDFTIRLWDLGQQRCVTTFDFHEDAVWTLAAVTENLSSFVSGGRDRNVFRTELSSGRTALLCTETDPVLRVLVTPPAGSASSPSLWVTTTSPTINNWALDAPSGSASGSAASSDSKRAKVAVPIPGAVIGSSPPDLSTSPSRGRVVTKPPPAAPLQTAPRLSIAGRPGIVKHLTLNNRRLVLTRDTAGRVDLWDVTKGIRVAEYGAEKSVEDRAAELNETVSVPTWFNIDLKTGSVMVHLDYPQCFHAEVYAADAGMDTPKEMSEETKVSIGERVLSALFVNFLLAVEKDRQLHPPPSPTSAAGGDTSGSESDTKKDKKEKKEKKEKKDKKKTDAKEKQPEETAGGADDANKPRSQLPKYVMPPDISLIISEEATGSMLYRTTVGQMTGAESFSVIPQWLVEHLLDNKPYPSNVKISFTLCPADEKDKNLTQRLSAHRLLKMKRVLGHVRERLEYGVMADDGGGSKVEREVEDCLELVCNGQVLSPEVNLGTVKAFVWKSGDELVLQYRPKSQFATDRRFRLLKRKK